MRDTNQQEAGAPETHALASRLDGLRGLWRDDSFRPYWFSTVSFGLGFWMWSTVLGWTALRLTDSAFMISVANAATFLPMFLFALPAGVLADKLDRRRTSIASRGVCAVVVTVTAVLAATDLLTFPLLCVAAFLVGTTIISEVTSRQALLAEIVGPDQLVHATAVTGIQAGAARVIGPIVCGALIENAGDTGGYAAFAAANVVCVVMLLRVRVRNPAPRSASARTPLRDLVEGLRYLRARKDPLAVVVVSVLTGSVGWVYLALMPVMARDVLGGTAVTYGALSMAVGLGSVPGGMLLALTRTFRSIGRTFVLTLLLWGLGVVGFALSRSLPLSMALLFVAGFGFGIQVILVKTILLRVVDPGYHGRVFALLMLTWGTSVAGTLGAGTIAEQVGAAWAVALSGVLIIVCVAAVVAWNPRVLRL